MTENNNIYTPWLLLAASCIAILILALWVCKLLKEKDELLKESREPDRQQSRHVGKKQPANGMPKSSDKRKSSKKSRQGQPASETPSQEQAVSPQPHAGQALPQPAEPLQPVEQPTEREYAFLRCATDGRFAVPAAEADGKTFFRVWDEDGQKRFEFHGNERKALANPNAVFDGVCELHGRREGATAIENVTPGVLTSDYAVQTPAVLRLHPIM